MFAVNQTLSGVTNCTFLSSNSAATANAAFVMESTLAKILQRFNSYHTAFHVTAIRCTFPSSVAHSDATSGASTSAQFSYTIAFDVPAVGVNQSSTLATLMVTELNAAIASGEFTRVLQSYAKEFGSSYLASALALTAVSSSADHVKVNIVRSLKPTAHPTSAPQVVNADSSSSASGGATIGAVVGGVLALAVVGALAYVYFLRGGKKSSDTSTGASTGGTDEGTGDNLDLGAVYRSAGVQLGTDATMFHGMNPASFRGGIDNPGVVRAAPGGGIEFSHIYAAKPGGEGFADVLDGARKFVANSSAVKAALPSADVNKKVAASDSDSEGDSNEEDSDEEESDEEDSDEEESDDEESDDEESDEDDD